jgi:hypothetical protein
MAQPRGFPTLEQIRDQEAASKRALAAVTAQQRAISEREAERERARAEWAEQQSRKLPWWQR